MKLWTLAEISGELATAPQISSTPGNNLITLNNDKSLCHLPYVFPFTDSSGSPWNAIGTYEGFAAIALAAQHLNAGDGSIVPEVAALANNKCGVKFNVAAFDTALSESIAVDQIIQITDRTNAQAIANGGPADDANVLLRPPCVILGAARSAVTMPTSLISGLRGFPQISPISTSPALDDKSQYRYFARTIPNDDGTSVPLIARLNSGSGDDNTGAKDESESWGVNHLAVLYVDDAYGNAFAQGIVLAAKEMAPGMQIETFSLAVNPDDAQIQRVIASMAESQYMYFFAILASSYDEIMTAAYNAGIAGTGKHTWLFSDGVGSEFTGRDFTVGSPLERAYRGTGTLSAQGGMPGMKAYDALVEGLRELGESVEDKEYLNSLLPNQGITNHTDVTDSDSYLMTPGFVAPFLYDAVISAGLSACNLEMNHNTTDGSFALSGGDHYDAIVASTFEGTSGTIVFNSETGTRNPKSALFTLSNFVDDPDASTSDVVQFKSQETDVFEFGAWRSLQPFVFNNGDTIAPPDLPETEVDRNYIPAVLRSVGLTLCGVIIVLSIGFTVWTKKKEKIRIVKAAQPIFLYIIAIGTLLMGCAVIPLSLDPGVVSMEGASIACVSVPWLLACGFSMTFSALFTKTHRILTIMRNAAAFKRVKVTALDVAKPMICLLLANIITLSVWTGIDPRSSKTIVLQTNRFGKATETESICYSEHQSIFLSVLGVINLGALLVAFVEAYLARNISVELSESAYIMKAISIILLVCLMGIPVIIIAQENTSAFYFVAVGIIFTVCISILCLIFVPKIRASMKPPPAKKKHRSASGGPDISRTSTQSDTDNSGIKILSSPMAMAELEEENRRLKQMAETMRASKSVRRWSNEIGLEESRRLSQMSNDSMVESDVATGNEKRVTFERPNSSDIENHTEMDAVDEEGEGGVIKEEENNGEEASHNEKNVDEEEGVIEEKGNIDEEESHIEMNVVDAEEGVDEEDIEKEEQVDNIVRVV
ncbi:GABA-B receptor-like protein [Skeletonema marinoi]|uniref:GABA-B receptor-like protein n=1 Tax=Skeletonema marinoi TaxID=267567 RepID=A0AAD8Y7S0_9STRA|nr:GABA-B receptor-like protein [Skeletonema marinoi]